MKSIPQFLAEIKNGDFKSLARGLTIVENELSAAAAILSQLQIDHAVPVIGITGPPGAGKSTLVNALLARFCAEKKKVAVLAVDPTSPFNLGSLLGDRIRMSAHFNHPDVYIRSVASRGSVGGLSAKIIEMTDLLKSADFDCILVETVGVGQSEIEIAGLADTTFVVLVPEGGDEIQQMKSGLMEIADAFIVNKADREGADHYASQLRQMLHGRAAEIPVFKTQADKEEGIPAILSWLRQPREANKERQLALLSSKAYQLIRHRRMQHVTIAELEQLLSERYQDNDFNLYHFVARYDL